jgi:hypothetical protein
MKEAAAHVQRVPYVVHVLLQIFFVHFGKSDLQKSYGLRYFCITKGLKATHLSVCKYGDDVAAGSDAVVDHCL